MKTGVLQRFKGLCCILWLSLCFLGELEGGRKASIRKKKYKINVSFDPQTAHPNLLVSPDRKTVTWVPKPQDVPDNPERFNSTRCLLGFPRFSSGKYYWEVEYANQKEWAVGVARESVERKRYLRLTAEEGIWQKGLWWLWRRGTHSRRRPNHSRKIGVFLDYERGKVTFYMKNKAMVINTSFNREIVRPFFYVGATVSLTL
ncbi:vespryn-like [Sceloporus undulatus]|uniref:vespryn-like n=1 Tax=Sceloporus undulatus TaxID=8520 RepID=UPI001C4CD99B|nr:vespryn-like [Sceloporus undulatus]XP_042311003.1 vespryn-like [Sceloporus undulatus]